MIVQRLVLALTCMTFAIPTDALADPPEPAVAPEPPIAPEPPVAPEPAVAPEPPGFAFAFASEHGRARLGAHVSSMTPELRKFLGAKADAGILVQRVDADSAAARAGMKVGDVIVSVDGDAIDQIEQVAPALADRGKGTKVDVMVVRKKARRRLRVVMQDEAQPSAPSFGHDTRRELEQLRESIESLEMRVDRIDRARRRASKSKP